MDTLLERCRFKRVQRVNTFNEVEISFEYTFFVEEIAPFDTVHRKITFIQGFSRSVSRQNVSFENTPIRL